jgi:competence protein ComEA
MRDVRRPIIDDASIARGRQADRQRRWRVLSLLVVAASVLLLGRWALSHRAVAGDSGRLVELAGSVPRPGLYAVDPGATVSEALEQAGIFAEVGSDPLLDRVLDDGSRVVRQPDGSLSLVPPEQHLLFGLRLDANTVDASELETLPGVGPALAAAIVADREARGPFGRFEDLDRVSGVGPALLERLRAYVQVVPVATTDASAEGGDQELPSGAASATVVSEPEARAPVNLNTATQEELESLPGIGPQKASAILAYRQRHSRFRSVGELVRVRGIGSKTLKRLRPMLTLDGGSPT